MKFAILDVMDKGAYLSYALAQAGHEPVPVEDAGILLLDCDWSWASPRPELIAQAVERGTKVALYPHGGQPTMFVYDGLTEPDPGVDLRLEHGPRNLDLADKLGLDLRQEAHGWLYSPTAPFRPVNDPKRVLFAPLHPNIEAMQKGGPDPAPGLNSHVYRQLLALGYDITVSVVGPLWKNGLWFHPRARLVSNPQMRLQASLPLVQEADVVVAAGTLAAAAVALGKPTVMLGGHDCCDYIDGAYTRAHNADAYEDWFRYPLNAEDDSLENLIGAACVGHPDAAAWRADWIGDDGTASAIRALGHLVGEPKQQNVSIAGVRAESVARASI